MSKTVKGMSRRESIAFSKSDVMFGFKDTKLNNLLSEKTFNNLNEIDLTNNSAVVK